MKKKKIQLRLSVESENGMYEITITSVYFKLI